MKIKNIYLKAIFNMFNSSIIIIISGIHFEILSPKKKRNNKSMINFCDTDANML